MNSPNSHSANQCDGCRRGLPLRANGIHYEDKPFPKACAVMACTKELYMTERTDAPKMLRELDAVLNFLQADLESGHIGRVCRTFIETYGWEIKARLSEIGAPGELESLRVFQRKIEEAEARCCPEDVGFEEYIAALKKRLAIPSNMEDRFLIQECATWIRRLAARIKQYQPQLAKKAVDWLHRKEIQGSPLRDAETISDSETPEVRKEREGYETAIALSYECDRLREELAKARSAIGALTFDAFRSANVARCVKWHPAGIASWSPSDWLTAVTGELGELASLLKMRNRERDGLPGNKFSPSQKQIADELADVLTYLDLLAEVLGVDLGRAAALKFNEVSERAGFPDRINVPTDGSGAL